MPNPAQCMLLQLSRDGYDEMDENDYPQNHTDYNGNASQICRITITWTKAFLP